jgi:hypothetical protein
MAIYRNLIVDADGSMADITADGALEVADAVIAGAKDDVTGLIGTIEMEHHEIHEGEHFFIQEYTEVANAGVLNYVFVTGAKDVHMTFGMSGADAGFILQTYEGVTADSDGTLITPLNNKRAATLASTVVVRKNPGNIVTTAATLLRSGRYGSGGAVSTRREGNMSRGNEAILKKATKYLVRLTNLSTSANNINVDFNWYEES